MEFKLAEEGRLNIKKIKDNEKMVGSMDLRSTIWLTSMENKITREEEIKEPEASVLEESSMCKSSLNA